MVKEEGEKLMYDELVKRLRNHAIRTDSGHEIGNSMYLDIFKAADAIEELQLYVDLYKDLTEKAEKVAREVIDKYPKWTPCSERLPDYDEDVLVTDFYDTLGWSIHVWHRTHDGTGTDYWEAEDGHFIGINYTEYWMPRPKLPKESERND